MVCLNLYSDKQIKKIKIKNNKQKGYIGDFELIDDKRNNKIVVELLGRLNKVGVVSPRFDVKLTDGEMVTKFITIETIWISCINHIFWYHGS